MLHIVLTAALAFVLSYMRLADALVKLFVNIMTDFSFFLFIQP